jgi:hypothetical protein
MDQKLYGVFSLWNVYLWFTVSSRNIISTALCGCEGEVDEVSHDVEHGDKSGAEWDQLEKIEQRRNSKWDFLKALWSALISHLASRVEVRRQTRTRLTALLAVIVRGTQMCVHLGPLLAATASPASGAGAEREGEAQTARTERKGKSAKKNMAILSL